MLFAATAIANGSGLAVVNSIGMGTEIGKIQSQIQEAAKEEDDTPLKKKLDEFGEALAKVQSCAMVLTVPFCQLIMPVYWQRRLCASSSVGLRLSLKAIGYFTAQPALREKPR